jgi:hypothetical protein
MAQTVVVRLTDDIDGGEADESISFALNGQEYEIDLSSKNAEKLREVFAPFIEKARRSGRTASEAKTHSSNKVPGTSVRTLFSGLDAAEKKRFRTWGEMPTARRISDVRVQEWINAGRP